MTEDQDNVIPMSVEKVGFRTRVQAWQQADDKSPKVAYTTEYWTRKDDVVEVIGKHNEAGCILLFKSGKSVNCEESFDAIVKKLERRS